MPARSLTSATGASPAPQPTLAHLGGLIAVASGKGGVGKSTVSANLAVALARHGLRVGLVDADLYGPSIPGMLGIPVADLPAMSTAGKVVPAEAQNVKVISMAMLTGDDKPAILRGPMVTRYLRMFVTEVDWGTLDVLLLDLPPGTGDIQLSLAQSFPLTGAVVVSTPQDVSLKIARRGLRMFEQVSVPILGIIENMSGFTCPCCGTVTDIFHRGGGQQIAESLGVRFLGAIPIDPAVVDGGDSGRTSVTETPDSPAARVFMEIAEVLANELAPANGLQVPFDWSLVDGTGQPAPVSSAPTGRPLAIEYDEGGLTIRWPSRVQRIDPRDLRLACHCAACRDELSGQQRLDAAKVPLDVEPVRIWSVGNYALGIAFSDGHDSGIYSYEVLAALASVEVEDV